MKAPAVAAFLDLAGLLDDDGFCRGLALAVRDHTCVLMNQHGWPFDVAAAVARVEFAIVLHLLVEDGP